MENIIFIAMLTITCTSCTIHSVQHVTKNDIVISNPMVNAERKEEGKFYKHPAM